MKTIILAAFLALTTVGCSLKKMAIRSATPTLEESAQGITKEKNWDFFRASSPGNIKFMELIWEQDKDNLRLLSVLIKSYAGYAFAVSETLYFEDEILGTEESSWKNEAIDFYTRALDYGLYYLNRKGLSENKILTSSEEVLKKELSRLNEEDFIALLYTAQAWGSLINLQKDNISLISHVSKVKLMFDRVCEARPEIDHNICNIFYAQYEASRPKMLGGNPERGEKLFLDAIEKYPQNLLLSIAYIQSVILPSMDEEKYEKVAVPLRNELAKWSDLNRDELKNISPYRDAPQLNLFNSIAKKRFSIIEKNKKKIF